MKPALPLRAGPYKVVPHLDRFRIEGATGEAGLMTFVEQADAEKQCRILTRAYWHGSDDKALAIRTVLGSER